MYEFMSDVQAKELFAKIDYTLRAGTHVQQQYHGQEAIFRFIRKYRESLTLYYKKFFNLDLQSGGYGDQEYFFVVRNTDEINRIPSRLRNSLREEFLIIGIFLCKLFYIDFSEIETVKDFKKALKEDYEPFKANFYRLLAHSKSDTYTLADDEAVELLIDKAFREFDHLGWIKLDEDFFEVMPSLERLRLLYQNEIQDINNLIRDE